MNSYKLSICIPTYNRCEFLEQTLKSVYSQGLRPDIEVLVVDNASTDKTSEVARKYNTRYIKNESNIGIDKNINKCVFESSGKYVHILSDDDILVSGALDEIQKKIQEDPDFVFLNGYIFNNNPYPIRNNKKIFKNVVCENFSNPDKFLSSIWIWATFVSSFVVKREKWVSIKDQKNFFGTDILLAYALYSICINSSSLIIIRKPCIAIRTQYTGSYNIMYAFSYQWRKLLMEYAPTLGYNHENLKEILKRSLIYDLVPRVISIASRHKIKKSDNEYQYLMYGMQDYTGIRIATKIILRSNKYILKAVHIFLKALRINNINSNI